MLCNMFAIQYKVIIGFKKNDNTLIVNERSEVFASFVCPLFKGQKKDIFFNCQYNTACSVARIKVFQIILALRFEKK